MHLDAVVTKTVPYGVSVGVIVNNSSATLRRGGRAFIVVVCLHRCAKMIKQPKITPFLIHTVTV